MNGLDKCRNDLKPLELGLAEPRIRSVRGRPAPEFDQFGAGWPQNSISLGLADGPPHEWPRQVLELP